MAKSKTGPPYTGRNAEYVVVTTPWGMKRVPRSRVSQDFNNLAAWVQLILQDKDIHAQVELIFSMGTRDEVIVQLPLGTDIQPLLGEHKWAIISKKWDGNQNDDKASCFFEYNFRNNGDPGNHNWAEECPNVSPEDVPPVKSPYPEPGWAEPPRSIRSLVLPIPPRPLLPTPEAEPTLIPAPTPIPVPVLEKTHLSFLRPQHLLISLLHSNLTSPLHNTLLTERTSTRQISQETLLQTGKAISQLQPKKCLKKLDPYQEEEDALALLRASPRDSQSDSKPVKLEYVKRDLTQEFDTEAERGTESWIEQRTTAKAFNFPPAICSAYGRS
ncbi:hypothetical protein F4604DRAFT_1679777 [Suillus subluteus]|nr:hypothetical protein F4604DRAFT_1679777 [Suillus subluteus]